MKLAVRIFALSVVFAGVAAAATVSSSSHVIASHQAAAADLPVPQCGPGIPGCTPSGGGGGGNVQ